MKRKSAKEKRGNVRETREDKGSTLCDLSAFLPFQQQIFFLHYIDTFIYVSYVNYLILTLVIIKITLVIQDNEYLI